MEKTVTRYQTDIRCTVTPRFTKASAGPHDVLLKIVRTVHTVRGGYYSERLAQTTVPNVTRQEAKDAAQVFLDLYLMSHQSLTGK